MYVKTRGLKKAKKTLSVLYVATFEIFRFQKTFGYRCFYRDYDQRTIQNIFKNVVGVSGMNHQLVLCKKQL